MFVGSASSSSTQSEFTETYRCLRFVKKIDVSIEKHRPTAKTISGLSPNCFHAIYIGGVCGSDAVSKFASFFTPNMSGESYSTDSLHLKSSMKVAPRFIIAQGGRLDEVRPNEVNLFQSVENRVNHSQQLSGLNTVEDFSPIQTFIHCGNLLSVDGIIQNQAIDILQYLLRDDSECQSWLQGLDDLEHSVREMYRRALNDESLASIMRRCSTIFLADNGEAAKDIIALFSTDSTDSTSESSRSGKYFANMNYEVNHYVSSEAKKIQTKKSKQNRAKDDSSAAGSLSSRLLMGESVRKARQEAKKRDAERVAMQDELRMLLLGAIIRLIR